MRVGATNHYAQEASKIAEPQAAANIAADKANRHPTAGGVERGYRNQIVGVD